MKKDRFIGFAGTRVLKVSTEVQGIKEFQNEMSYPNEQHSTYTDPHKNTSLVQLRTVSPACEWPKK